MNKLKFFCCLFILGFGPNLKSQVLDSLTLDSLQSFELRLSGLGEQMVRSFDEGTRITSGKQFIRHMARALKINNSYFFPFDSLKNVMIIKAPDDFFRIISWNVATNDEKFRYFGVIQMNPLKIKKLNKKTALYKDFYPLIDRSDSINNFLFKVVDTEHWFGATYYKIIKTNYKKVDYYTVLGWDGAGPKSNKKIADVLIFNNGVPFFGSPVFDIKHKSIFYRMVFEFNNNATMTLRYEDKLKYLIYENIVPDKPSNIGSFENYLPDGSFEYLIWKKGIWEKQPESLKLFNTN